MTLNPRTFLFMLIFLGCLLISNMVLAYEPMHMTQSYDSVSEIIPAGKTPKTIMRHQLEDMLFQQAFDQFFKYEMGSYRTTGYRIKTSLGLKLRSDETYLQFRMTF